MPRVLHIASGNLYGGVETLLITVGRQARLAPDLEQHFAVCFEGRLSAELRAAGVPVHVLGEIRLRNPLSIRRARGRLRVLLARERIDVTIAHSAWAMSAFGRSLRGEGGSCVYWLHDAPDPDHWLYRLARRTRPDLVVCTSRYTAELVPRLYPGVSSEVIHCPVESANVALAGEDPGAVRAAIRAELLTPADAVVIIQVSRLEGWKGHELHLRALGRLGDLPGWVLWVAGGAQRPEERHYLDRLRQLAAELRIGDRVRFLGHRSDVRRVLAAADLFCQPNTGPEPFGLAFVEALYAGLPCVTTDLGGAREIVDATCGIRVPPGDPEALASAIRSLIVDAGLRQRLGAQGPERAEELCDPASRMAQLSARVEGLVATRTG